MQMQLQDCEERFFDDWFALDDIDVGLSIVDNSFPDLLARCVNLLFANKGRIAVKIRIGEQARSRAGVIDDVEPELAVIVAHARPASDDLLEFGHRPDDASDARCSCTSVHRHRC